MAHVLDAIHSRKDLGVLGLLLALILARLGFAWLVFARPELAIANDTDRYVPIANAILSGQALLPITSHTGLLLNTVGYPLFLAGVYLFLGHATGDVALAQLALSGLLALILYLALSRRMGVAAALVPALILIFDPLTTLWSMTVLTEVLLAVVLGLAAIAITAWAVSPKTATLLLAGVLCGLACLVKPYAILAVAIWAFALLFYPSSADPTRRQSLMAGVRRALLFVAPTIILATPWIIRNAVIWDCPGLSSVDRVSMRDYVAAKILSEANQVPLEQVQAQLRAVDPGVCPVDNAKYVDLVFSHFGIFAKLHASGTIPILIGTNFDRWLQYFGIQYTLPDLWGPFVDGGPGKLASVLAAEWIRFPQGLTLMASLILFQLIVYALVVAGVLVVRGLASPAVRWNAIILTLTILAMVLTPGQGGNERFRVPVQPLMAILIGYGIEWKIRPSLKRLRASPQHLAAKD